MNKTLKTWLVLTAIFQLLTMAMHSLSLIVKPQAQNDTEKQMLSLVQTYQLDMGSGFHPTMFDLYTSFSMSLSLLLLFGALLSIMLIRHNSASLLARNIMAIQSFIFAACFLVMLAYTFIVPIICLAFIMLACIGSWWLLRKNASAG